MLIGENPDREVLTVFEQVMIIQAEHESNVSTFSARIATSTGSEVGNAVLAAISSFSGNLHGGALLATMEMLEEIKNVKDYIQNRINNGLPIFGFGHRVYRHQDPRSIHLEQTVKFLSKKYKNVKWLTLLEQIKQEMAVFVKHGIDVNVDYYASISLLLMGIEKDLFVPIFISNRLSGWAAHIIEQSKNNILIRPRLKYTGTINKSFSPIDKRI